jgi:hypothetical protein
MIDLLNKLSKKYYLQLGDYRFSNLTKLTAGISLEYCKMTKEQKCLKEPFVFCLPEKKAAALWTSISILTNYYLEDYVNIGDEGIVVQIDEKVMIYGCVAQIARIQNGKYFLRFKGNGTFQLNDKLKSQLSRVDQNRALNLHSRYNQKRKEAKNNRNSISKILYPNDEVFIAQRNLKSKILLVAGRGQVKTFHNFLETVEIYGEKLQRVFPEGENLIITPDLKRYKIDAGHLSDISLVEFIDLLKKAAKNEKFQEVRDEIGLLLETFKISNQITEEFDQLFVDLVHDFIDTIPHLKILGEKYPGLSKELESNIRAVVINEATQLIEYPDTIRYFLDNKIPVIVFVDRKIISSQDTTFYRSIFRNLPNSYRLNWNKKKINSIKSLDKGGVYFFRNHSSGNEVPCKEDSLLDQELWNQALRYERQMIRIKICLGNTLDTLAPKLINYIKELDEFELFQKSFYRNFYPVLYALKNSQNTNQVVKQLIGRFKTDLSAVQNHLPDGVAQDFLQAILICESFEGNTKDIESHKNVFSIKFPNDFDENFIIPINAIETYTPKENSDSIIFSGYPFDEYSGNYLINSVCKFFIPEIELKCWPNEASITYSYLKRRIEGGYFYDNLPVGIDFEKDLKIESAEDIESEIDLFLLSTNQNSNIGQPEEDLTHIHQFKYKGYLLNQEGPLNWQVKCDVLNFENGDFMFLAKGSSILCLSEDIQGKIKVFKKSADQFLSGDVIFRFIKDRAAYLELSKRDFMVAKSYEELDFWKNTLNELYSKNHYSTKSLEKFLVHVQKTNKLKGNPVYANLERWLFDEEIISPDEDNLRLILSASKVLDVEERLTTLKKAYKIATAHRISLSTRIKNEISKKIFNVTNLNGNFPINIDGESIDVQTRAISTVDRNGIQVDYHNTRKILC